MSDLLELPLIERTSPSPASATRSAATSSATRSGPASASRTCSRWPASSRAPRRSSRAPWTAGPPASPRPGSRTRPTRATPLIAVKMNDEPLPADHGFPARLIVPGLYGYVSATKWLSELELTTLEAFDAYWVPRGWAKEAPILTQSRIDTPRSGRRRCSRARAGRAASPGRPTAGSRRSRSAWTAATLAGGHAGDRHRPADLGAVAAGPGTATSGRPHDLRSAPPTGPARSRPTRASPGRTRTARAATTRIPVKVA